MKRVRFAGALVAVSLGLVVTAVGVGAGEINVPGDHAKIQDAVNAAYPGDIVRVAAGTYAPSINGEVFPISMRNGVSLIGAGADVCILDAEGTNGVIYCSGVTDPATTIEGFTITNGSAVLGGGICCDHSSPAITNNTITQNSSADFGGGIDLSFSSSVVTSNTITENSSPCGAGVSCRFEGTPMIAHNTITRNSGEFGGGGESKSTSNASRLLSATV